MARSLSAGPQNANPSEAIERRIDFYCLAVAAKKAHAKRTIFGRLRSLIVSPLRMRHSEVASENIEAQGETIMRTTGITVRQKLGERNGLLS